MVLPDGAPHAGARVALCRRPGVNREPTSDVAPLVAFALSDDQLDLGFAVEGDPGLDLPPPIATAATDGQGRFRFAGLGPGRYALTATARRQGLGPGTAEVPRLAAGETKVVKLVLSAAGFLLTGRVREESEAGPVPGARVTAVLAEGGGDPRAVANVFVSEAGSDGAYSLSLMAGRYVLRAEADGYAPASEPIVVAADIDRDLRIEPAGRLSGRVVERATGHAAAGIQLQVRRLEGWNLGRSRQVESDIDGAFHVAGLGFG